MTQDFHFLLMPGFSALGFISALEPLRVANRFRGELYRWHILSADGGAVTVHTVAMPSFGPRASSLPVR